MFLPHIDVFFDLLPYRPAVTWNIFISYNNKITYVCNDDVIFASVLPIISYSHTEDGILGESKIFRLSLFDLNTRRTILGTEHDKWHSKRFFPSTTVTFDRPSHKNHVLFHRCHQGLPREYPAGVQASSSLLRWSSTVPGDHHYTECLLLKLSLRVLKGKS